MSTYISDELISSTDISKRFWTYLNMINTWKVKKIWILKNNKIEAVMFSWKLYELIWDYLEDFLENIEINEELQKRLKTKKEDYLDWEKVLKELNLSL